MELQHLMQPSQNSSSTPLLWRIEMVQISFNFCHIVNGKAVITDITSQMNYK